MQHIDIFVESRYPVDRRKIKRVVGEALGKNGVKGDVEVSISVVGDRKMAKLNQQYRNKEGTTPVLAFPALSEEKAGQADFPESPDGVLHLGDVIVSYPQARELAKQYNRLVDRVIGELVEHGVGKLCST